MREYYLLYNYLFHVRKIWVAVASVCSFGVQVPKVAWVIACSSLNKSASWFFDTVAESSIELIAIWCKGDIITTILYPFTQRRITSIKSRVVRAIIRYRVRAAKFAIALVVGVNQSWSWAIIQVINTVLIQVDWTVLFSSIASFLSQRIAVRWN